MNVHCSWCARISDTDIEGCIILLEKNPIDEDMEDETYSFCTYKCLRNFLGYPLN